MSDMFSVSSERLDDDLGRGHPDRVRSTSSLRRSSRSPFSNCWTAGVKRLVVDLSGVTFIDSTALGVLIGGVRRVHGTGGAMTIVVTTRPVERVLSVTGLDRVFSMHATRDEALAALA